MKDPAAASGQQLYMRDAPAAGGHDVEKRKERQADCFRAARLTRGQHASLDWQSCNDPESLRV